MENDELEQNPQGNTLPTPAPPQNNPSKKNSGVMGSLNNISSGVQQLRQVQQYVQYAANAVKVVGMASNPFFWVGVLIIFLIFIIFFTGAGGGATRHINNLLGGDQKPGTPGPGSSIPPSSGGLDYYIPFKDPSVSTDGLREIIQTNWPKARIENYDTIVQKSIQNGWNPAFVLTLWIEETGGQAGTSLADGDPGGYSDALGCDPSHPTSDINTSLSCLFGPSFSSLKSDQFNDFMCQYGGDAIKAPCSFASTNPNFPPGVKTVYSKLVPSGPGALIPVEPIVSSSGLVSCPIPGATVTCGSKFTPRYDCGHCGLNYPDTTNSCSNPNYIGINYAEDIGGNDLQPYVFPSIGGHNIDWTFSSQTSSSPGVTLNYSGIDPLTNDQYWLEYHHSDAGSNVSSGKSGETAGRICGNGCGARHVHVELAKVGSSGRQYIDGGADICSAI